MVEREGVLGRGRDWRGDRSKTAAQNRADALNHNDMIARIDDEHDLTLTGRAVRDSEVTAGNSRVSPKGCKARSLEGLSAKGKGDAVIVGRADNGLACRKSEREGAIRQRAFRETEGLAGNVEHMDLHMRIFLDVKDDQRTGRRSASIETAQTYFAVMIIARLRGRSWRG